MESFELSAVLEGHDDDVRPSDVSRYFCIGFSPLDYEIKTWA